ncbi:MAG: flap structure-specific endonuclease, partial [Candidatus Nitrosopelagicus sp.]|nr:flap structure-specific endonuclease [Candidatus Nitrosopelagicus sp.]
KYLSEERDFSKDRVETSLNRLKKSLEKKSQTLEQWFT